MRQNLHRILLPGLVLGSLLWMPGCYTQLGTTRDEYHEEYSSAEDDTTGDNYEQSYTDNYDGYGYDDGMVRPQYGFDYYYPTFGFGFSTYDPWYWRYSGWYYYDPFVCGTYYPVIYAGYHYWPHFGFYSPYRYRNYASIGGGRRGYGTTRTIGTTRGGGVVRAGGGRDETAVSRGASSGGVNLPTGYRSASGTRNTPPAGTTNTPRVSTGRKSSDTARGGTRTNTGSRVGTTRGGSRGTSGSSQPRTYTPPPRNQGGDRGGSGRTYSPPPSSPPPQQSTPPSDAGRSSGSSGGSRGGRGR